MPHGERHRFIPWAAVPLRFAVPAQEYLLTPEYFLAHFLGSRELAEHVVTVRPGPVVYELGRVCLFFVFL